MEYLIGHYKPQTIELQSGLSFLRKRESDTHRHTSADASWFSKGKSPILIK